MKKALFVFFLVPVFFTLSAQTNTAPDSIKNVTHTANDLKSGNMQDVLSSFFQLGLNDLLTNDRSFSFNSNFFAIMLKNDPSLNSDRNYAKYTFQRNSYFNFKLKVDENFNYNGSTFGYNYAIINKRDYTIAKDFAKQLNEKLDSQNKFAAQAAMLISGNYSTSAQSLIYQTTQFNNFLNGIITYNELSDTLKNLFYSKISHNLIPNDNDNFKNITHTVYNNLIDDYNKKLLWFVDVNGTTFANAFVFEKVNINSVAAANLIKLNDYTDLEFNVAANFLICNDSTKPVRNLDRQVASLSGSLNLVIRNNQRKAFCELQAGMAYNSIFKGAYSFEQTNFKSFDATLRYKVNDVLWLPLTLRYDPNLNKVITSIGLKANLTPFNKN